MCCLFEKYNKHKLLKTCCCLSLLLKCLHSVCCKVNRYQLISIIECTLLFRPVVGNERRNNCFVKTHTGNSFSPCNCRVCLIELTSNSDDAIECGTVSHPRRQPRPHTNTAWQVLDGCRWQLCSAALCADRGRGGSEGSPVVVGQDNPEDVNLVAGCIIISVTQQPWK